MIGWHSTAFQVSRLRSVAGHLHPFLPVLTLVVWCIGLSRRGGGRSRRELQIDCKSSMV